MSIVSKRTIEILWQLCRSRRTNVRLDLGLTAKTLTIRGSIIDLRLSIRIIIERRLSVCCVWVSRFSGLECSRWFWTGIFGTRWFSGTGIRIWGRLSMSMSLSMLMSRNDISGFLTNLDPDFDTRWFRPSGIRIWLNMTSRLLTPMSIWVWNVNVTQIFADFCVHFLTVYFVRCTTIFPRFRNRYAGII